MMDPKAAEIALAALAAADASRSVGTLDEYRAPKASEDHSDKPCCGGTREMERRRKRMAKQAGRKALED